MKKNMLLTLMTCCLMVTTLFTGCGQEKEELSSAADNVTTAVGHLTLSVNPEIMISYNKDGRVTEVKGKNADGEDIVENYDDYIGKYCGRVLTELVDEIHEAGYFVEEADGSPKQIVLELEAGSKMPDDDFLDELSGNVQQAVTRLDLTSDVVVRDDDHYDDTNYGSDDDGVSNYFDDKDYDDTDYGPNNDGVTDYDDTDYGPNNDGVTDYDDTDYGPNNDGVTDYDDTDYGPNNDGVTDYDDTDYGPNNDGVTDYDDTDYGPNNDGVTDYDDTDYGPNNDGVTDYDDTDYGPNNDGVTDYDDTDYGVNNDGVTDYAPPATQAPAVQAPVGGDSGYGDSGYDAGSNYGDSGYDD